MPKQKPEHDDPIAELVKKVDAILAYLPLLRAHMEKLMTQNDEIQAKLDEIDATTTEIGEDIDKLIAGGLVGLTQAEADAVIARLSQHADTLKATAAKS